jgi:hypothetical protein
VTRYRKTDEADFHKHLSDSMTSRSAEEDAEWYQTLRYWMQADFCLMCRNPCLSDRIAIPSRSRLSCAMAFGRV